MSRMPSRIAAVLAALALSGGACQLPPASPQQRTFLALADDPAGRVRGPYCQRIGPREWRHGFRAPTMCEAYYADSHTQWERRADGTVTRGARSWFLWPADSTRWGTLRDSVTAAMATLAGGMAACAIDQPYGSGGHQTAWALEGYDATVVRFEVGSGRFPGYYKLDAGIRVGRPWCRASRRLNSPGHG